MTTNDTKLRFVEMRANNMSLSAIASKLHISRGTCSKLEKELESDIAVKQAERKLRASTRDLMWVMPT